jgi:hypothetical protein
MAFTSFWKPAKGSSLLQKRTTRQARVAAEQKAMKAAKARDGQQCRHPRCGYKSKQLPIDPCHQVHRGMGGDPKGTRTTRATVISLCRIHHGLYDAGDLRIEPLTGQDFDGPCEFHERHPETGEFVHIGTEKRLGVSVAVGK